MTAARQKIAVLGGGAGALAAAFCLTEPAGWKDRYDITVYQMGWRLGGKGASGRNPQAGQRIEEHGLHIWFGFYDNAFWLMQRAYDELQRPPGAPLATWRDAFKPQQFIALTEHIDGKWKVWPIETPLKPGDPGPESEEITLEEIIATLKAWIKQWLQDLHGHLLGKAAPHAPAVLGLVQRVPQAFDPRNKEEHSSHASVLRELKEALAALVSAFLDIDDEARRIFIAIDLATVSLIGMLDDGLLSRGFDAINDIEYRDWLRKHGASEKYTIDCAPVRALYDLVFAYADGDFARPNIEAGTMLRGILRIAICYHGGLMWKMQAGMGDTVFTPLYEVLKRRGVQFEFFRKVKELIPDADGVAEIVLTEQVALAAGAAEYDPLVPVKGLPCWPGTPKYELLDPAQAELLKANDVNLESHWSDWPEIYAKKFNRQLPVKQLKRGEDFHKVVYGLSVGSLPFVCPKLLQASPALKATAENVRAVATQAYQVWTSKNVRELGWKIFAPNGEVPVLSAFTEPFDTWAPMDQLIPREDWPAAQAPGSIAYFCSAMPLKDFPPPGEASFPARCAQRVHDHALDHLQHQMFNLWPEAASPDSFDWPVLVDLQNASGQARFDAQFWRANIDPSELYVLSVVDSTRFRLTSESSGFDNLYLAGDWLKTGLNAGCVEAAVMGGMQASRAICGYPRVIKGEHDR